MKQLLFLILILSIKVSCLFGQDTFVATQIPDSIWQKMQGKTYVANPHIQRQDLRYIRILHWDYDEKTHEGELICNRLIADKLIAIFRELYKAHYPIQRMRLPDEYNADDELQMRDNNTSCFCYRKVSGSKNLSKHARGLAIDVNPLYNPYIRYRKDGSQIIEPANAKPYADRSKQYRYKIDKNDLCYKLFIKHGFTWGGAWRTMKDYQHFEYKL